TSGHPGVAATEPVPTLTTGQHQACVECALSPDDEAGALRVAAFLIRYYGEGGQLGDLHQPAATITTKERLALVTVHIQGIPYVITDIGLRMLQPRELYRAQGFPDDYIIDHGHDGRKFSKSNQVRFCGNSVSPPPAEALIRANYVDAGQAQQVRVA
ncbi:DNA cytosine methyltransferase, partial [Acidithiobacillus sp.]|uniref:DNA cytosine methyltransferase n=1 Tax=Acidithiobacillus sp. TaxID=1872118 RepID=UPI003D07161F